MRDWSLITGIRGEAIKWENHESKTFLPRLFVRVTVFDTNFWGCQPTGPTVSIFMFISQILSVIRADVNVISSRIVSPDQEISANGRR